MISSQRCEVGRVGGGGEGGGVGWGGGGRVCRRVSAYMVQPAVWREGGGGSMPPWLGGPILPEREGRRRASRRRLLVREGSTSILRGTGGFGYVGNQTRGDW